MARRRRVTILDVARAAGVSRTSVSYALNGAPGISPATRHRIREAAQALDYTPSSTARALSRGHDDTITCVLSDDTSPGALPLPVIVHLAADLETQGLTLVLRRRPPGQSVADCWRGSTPAAVLVVGRATAEDHREAADAQVALLPAAPDASPGSSDDVTALQQQTSTLQVHHLAERGHRHLAFVAATDERAQEWCETRRDGALRASLERGLHLPEVVDVPPTAQHAAQLIQQWRARTPRVTGAVAADDEVAGALLGGLRRLHLQAPTDLAVIGAGDDPLASLTSPPLTTVATNHRVLARQLARSLLESIGRAAPAPHDADTVSLVIRRST